MCKYVIRWFRSIDLTKTIMFVIIVAVVCCIIGFFFPVFSYDDPEHLIVTFIGVLATFAVVSNFSQVADIRNQTDVELTRLKEQLASKEKECNEKIDNTKKQIDMTDKELEEMEPLVDSLIRKELTQILKGVNGCFQFSIVDYKPYGKGLLHVTVEVYKREKIEDGNYDVNTKETELKTYIVNLANGSYKEVDK